MEIIVVSIVVIVALVVYKKTHKKPQGPYTGPQKPKD